MYTFFILRVNLIIIEEKNSLARSKRAHHCSPALRNFPLVFPLLDDVKLAPNALAHTMKRPEGKIYRIRSYKRGKIEWKG